jgi:formate C-acetyltransferase
MDILNGQRRSPATGSLTDYGTFEALWEALKAQIDYNTQGIARGLNDAIERRFSAGDPKISRSMFTRDCLETRRGFEQRGARYNWAVGSYDGTTVAIDSLYAIKHLVYDTKEISAERMLRALETDFVEDEELRQICLAVPKFGNDVAEVDELGGQLLEYTWGKMLEQKTVRGGRLVPSVILFQTYAGSGSYVCATPNGRHARMPLNDSVGAFEGADKNGPTALLNSVLKLPLHLAPGTPVLNMRFTKALLNDPAGRAGLKGLIRSFFAQGGMQMQITVMSAEEMRAAQAEPEKYGDLIVRIGGYSEYFVYLSPALQETVIKRSEHC